MKKGEWLCYWIYFEKFINHNCAQLSMILYICDVKLLEDESTMKTTLISQHVFGMGVAPIFLPIDNFFQLSRTVFPNIM